MCSGWSTWFRDEFKQSLGWRLFHVVVLLIRRWPPVIRISEWWQHWHSEAAEGWDVSWSRQRPDGISLAGTAEAMEASVAAGGVERWTVVWSSEEPEHVAHHEWEREVSYRIRLEWISSRTWQRKSLRVRILDTNPRTWACWSPYWDDSTTMVALRIFQVIGIGQRAVLGC